MTKRIFRAILTVALSVLAAALVMILGALYSHFANVQFSQLREETALAAHAVENEGLAYFDGLDSGTNCRITWIAADGSVLYDNRSDSGAMVNHLERAEVQSALKTGYGESSRYSDTLLTRYLYTAQRLADGTVLRLAATQSSVWNLLLGMSWFIVVVLGGAIVVSSVLADRLAREIVRPINDLNLDDPLANGEYEEIAPLLRRLEAQQRQLRAQERELRQKQKQFHTVTRSLSEGLVLVDSSGTILSINPAAAQLLEVTPHCLGADFSAANRNEAVSALLDQALSGQKAEQTVTLAAGTYLAAASPVTSDGVVSGVVLLLFDVTQKRQAEQLRREFTANVSHELKTPLHAISGYAELMKSGMVPQRDMTAFASKIYGEAQRMIRLVEDILRLSRLDEGAAGMRWEELDLYDAAQSAVRSLSAAAELGGISLGVEGGPTVISAVPQLVSGILFNLTDNAVKYNRPGGSVSLRIEDGGAEAVLTVADTGIGIPEEHRERIFERFYRVDKSHSKEVGGTGLGLSIVKHAALILGADISLDSTVGVGTTITVRFPKVGPPEKAEEE